MALVPIEISDKTAALGLGLDYRIDRSKIKEVIPITWFISSNMIDGSERMISDHLSVGESYEWPSTSETLSIASTDASDTSKAIRIYYWGTNTSEYESYEDITTNGVDGTTPVNTVNTMYRIRVIQNISPIPGTGIIFLGPSTATWVAGKPDKKYSSIGFDRGFSANNTLYCPPGWKLFNLAFEINSDGDQNNKLEFFLYRQPNILAPQLKYMLMHNFISSDSREYITLTTQSVTPGSITWITAKQHGTSSATHIQILAAYLLVKEID